MNLFRRKAVEIQQDRNPLSGVSDYSCIGDMPPGTKFRYLGRECVVIDYAPKWAAEHLGIIGMEFHYADNSGVIRQGRIVPRNYSAFRSAVEIIEAGVKS